MTTIIKDKFFQLCDDLLSGQEEFSSSELEHAFSIATDIDPVNKQKRMNIYQKKRDLLLKLAPDAFSDSRQNSSMIQ